MNLPFFIVSFFAFILSLIGALGNFFEKKWKWFFVMLACIAISGTFTSIELYLWLTPPPDREMPLVIRSPLAPL